MKVFIPQMPTRYDKTIDAAVPILDFEPAKQYGELVICLPPQVSLHFVNPAMEALREKMRHMTTDDYLLACGSPRLIAVSAVIAHTVTGGAFNLLEWDKRYGAYVNTRIDTRRKAMV